MSVKAKCLINAKYAAAADTTEYIVPSATTAIIDKFTATNTNNAAITITINIVPYGLTVDASNEIIKAYSVAASATYDPTELRNQILNTGDSISIIASVADKLVLRCSGREIA